MSEWQSAHSCTVRQEMTGSNRRVSSDRQSNYTKTAGQRQTDSETEADRQRDSCRQTARQSQTDSKIETNS